MSSKRSRVHPDFKTKYRVGNWSEYDQALGARGDLTLWSSAAAVDGWRSKPTGERGAQRQFSDRAIETALTLRLLFRLPLRQTEGFLRSLFALIGLDLEVPDHTTLSRRGATLDVSLRHGVLRGPVHLVIDSSGLSFVGEGEWAAAKHGRRGERGWRKLHLEVDAAGEIVVQALIDSSADDATTGVDLIEDVPANLASVTADAAYDTRGIYNAAAARGAAVIVPPIASAMASSARCPARDRTVRRVNTVGRT